MKGFPLALIFISVVFVTGAAVIPALAGEAATPAEVIAKVKEGAAFLSASGEAGLAEFNDPAGRWAFKDTYVFVYDCQKGICAAQSFNRSIVGKPIEEITDARGAPVGNMICEAAAFEAGRWIEYYFPEAGTGIVMRKLSFIYPVPGTPYVAGAGIYGGDEKVEDLNKQLEQ
jgi:cytochrome c